MNDPLEELPSGRPAIYFNSFAIGAGNADFTIILKLDNRVIVDLKASFTTAKTLAQKLSFTVEQFEVATDHPLMTAEETSKKLTKNAPQAAPEAILKK